MIYITGDTHGEQNRILEIENKSHIKNGDYLIICGDFGYIFEDSLSENRFLDDLSERCYTLIFADGNHECFPAIYKYPVVDFNGAKAHQIRNNIFHIMRGQVFVLENKSFFAMGGAYSMDKAWRLAIEDAGHSKCWWPEELPNNEEYDTAASSLKKINYKADYIITHTAPKEIIRRMGYVPCAEDMELTGFLEYIMYECKYKQWFFGHFHEDKQIDEKHRALLNDIVEIT